MSSADRVNVPRPIYLRVDEVCCTISFQTHQRDKRGAYYSVVSCQKGERVYRKAPDKVWEHLERLNLHGGPARDAAVKLAKGTPVALIERLPEARVKMEDGWARHLMSQEEIRQLRLDPEANLHELPSGELY